LVGTGGGAISPEKGKRDSCVVRKGFHLKGYYKKLVSIIVFYAEGCTLHRCRQ
jgi:hypothetical protein